MTAPQMIALLRAVRRADPLVNFRLLADNVPGARLKDGRRLANILDFSAWLRELGEEAARTEVSLSAERSTGPKVMLPRTGKTEIGLAMLLDNICSSCGHVHIGVSICGVDMGGAGSCDCKAEVRV